MSHAELAKYFRTEKQSAFSTNFFTDAENYEVWDEIDFTNLVEVDGEQTFEVKAEDLIFYAEGCKDPNPLMTDEEFAKGSPYKGLVPHPIFIITVSFWCIGIKGLGNWIRTPGARNPGQVIEIFEEYKVGEVIHAKLKPHDRYIKRGKCYLEYWINTYNQNNVLKSRWCLTLILPRTREDIRKFLNGMRGLDD